MTRAPETKGYLKITVNKPCQWPQEDCTCECSYCGHRPEPEIKECSCGLRKKIKTEIAFYKNYPLRDSTMCDADIIRALEDLLK